MKLTAGTKKYIVTQSQSDEDLFEDDYVTKTMGAFGFLQFLVCGAAVLSRCITSWNMMSIVFLTSKTEFSCTKFKDGLNRTVQNNTCYDDCVEYEYQSVVFQNTLISSFGLICSRAWLASFTQTVTMFGLGFGVALIGWFSDRFGRQRAYILSTVISVGFMIAAPFASNYWFYNFFRFFAGLGSGGIMTLSVVYSVEMVGQKYRELAGATSLIADGFAIMLLALVAYFSSTWQIFLLVFGSISFVFLIMILFVPESPRWLVSQKKTEEAIDMMTKVAKFNGLDTTHVKDTVIKAIEELKTEHSAVQKRSYLDLFSNADLAKVTIIFYVMWFVGGICYFGIHHYATLLGLDIFVIVPLMGLFQAIGNILVMPLTKYVGRKVSVFCTLIMTSALMTILIFVPDGHWGCAVITATSAIFTVAVMCIFYIYANELYPTPLRNMGLGAICTGSKVGAMVAPFVANVQPHWIPSTIFAVVPIVGAILCLILPETKGKKMKDIVD